MAGGPGGDDVRALHRRRPHRRGPGPSARPPLGHRYIGCEHLLLAAASTGEPAAAALREHGVTPQAVEAEIVRLVGLGQAASLFSALDREALASIGIDLDAVRARIEAAFGPDAFTRAAPDACRGNRPAWPKSPMARLLRRRRRSHAAAGQYASPGTYAHRAPPVHPACQKEPGALPPRGQGAARQLHRRRAPHARPRRHERRGCAAHPVGARRITGNPAYRHPRPLPASQLIHPGAT